MKFILSFLFLIGMIIGIGLGVPDTLIDTSPEIVKSEFVAETDIMSNDFSFVGIEHPSEQGYIWPMIHLKQSILFLALLAHQISDL